MKTPEGIRRLSLVIGGGITVAWTVFFIVNTVRYGWFEYEVLVWLTGAVVGWVGGTFTVRGLAWLGIWTVKGFRK